MVTSGVCVGCSRGHRKNFHRPDYEARYGDTGATIAEIDAPRVKSARQLPKALRERLAVQVASPRDRAAAAA